jgi:hypothetical protein
VDASREPLQEKVSQKETSEPSELGSVFGNRATTPADFMRRWLSSFEVDFKF